MQNNGNVNIITSHSSPFKSFSTCLLLQGHVHCTTSPHCLLLCQAIKGKKSAHTKTLGFGDNLQIPECAIFISYSRAFAQVVVFSFWTTLLIPISLAYLAPNFILQISDLSYL